MGSPHYADIAQRLISHLIARNGQITELVTGPDITANCCEPPPLKKSKVEQVRLLLPTIAHNISNVNLGCGVLISHPSNHSTFTCFIHEVRRELRLLVGSLLTRAWLGTT
jgi:hypothetical protein